MPYNLTIGETTSERESGDQGEASYDGYAPPTLDCYPHSEDSTNLEESGTSKRSLSSSAGDSHEEPHATDLERHAQKNRVLSEDFKNPINLEGVRDYTPIAATRNLTKVLRLPSQIIRKWQTRQQKDRIRMPHAPRSRKMSPVTQDIRVIVFEPREMEDNSLMRYT